MDAAIHGFSVPFSFPVHFTRDAWSAGNPIIFDTLRRFEPLRRHRLLVAIDDGVAAAHGHLVPSIEAYVAAHAGAMQLAAVPLTVPGGEPVKNDIRHTLDVVAHIHAAGLDRQSFVVAIGGGAVLDMVSFAAALTHRSVRTIRLPTTVLSQADSGVGVKNGINMFGKKNFLGTFAPPFAVVNDARFLETLDRRDRISGVSEIVKVALLRDVGLFESLEANAAGVRANDQEGLAILVRRSAELHIAHICASGDPFEFGSSRPLDFGHWVAHKLESLSDYRLRHGEAVAIGLAVDVVYSVRMGYLDQASADRILSVLETIGFELWDALLRQRDARGALTVMAGLSEFREHLGGELHVTMLRAIGRGFEVSEIDDAVVCDSIDELARRAEARGRGARPERATPAPAC